MHIILAPHVDDEALGCWSVFSDRSLERHVHYFFECTEVRVYEARRACAAVGATCSFGSASSYDYLTYVPPFCEALYVPAFSDSHLAHRIVNMHHRKEATHFYSVDLTRYKLALPKYHQDQKAKFLKEYYRSQAGYFESHPESSIFEDLAKTDTSITTVVVLDGMIELSVTSRSKLDLLEFAYNRALEINAIAPTLEGARFLLNCMASQFGTELETASVTVRPSPYSTQTLKVSL